MSKPKLLWLQLVGLLAACGAEETIAPPPPPPPPAAPAVLSIALHVTGDPTTLDQQRILGYRIRDGVEKPTFNIPLGPNDSTSLPLHAPDHYRVVRPTQTSVTPFGTPVGFARAWCAPTTSLSQLVLAVQSEHLAVAFSYDCPPALGNGTLELWATTTGTGELESSYQVFITRTGPGPAPQFYRQELTIPSNGSRTIDLPRGVYTIRLVEPSRCKTPVTLGLFTSRNNPASVMVHPDGETYVFQSSRRSGLVAFVVQCP